ncbi:hypothetical protein QFZ27_005928 [Inquilinus ginsengisoli]|uniref:hypothetical protein n=1 Tax=Inquilinus ginsengisoli TaxID=363840 RepID=UPI003D1986B1
MLRNHRRRGAWLGRNVLRRLLAKRFGALPPGDGRWTISREMWSTEALARHGNGRHDRTMPWGLHGPILMARRSGEYWVIDGSNRINHWAAAGDTSRHEALVIDLDRLVEARGFGPAWWTIGRVAGLALPWLLVAADSPLL